MNLLKNKRGESDIVLTLVVGFIIGQLITITAMLTKIFSLLQIIAAKI